MIPLLPILVLSTTKPDPNVATLKSAYAQAMKCDWETVEGEANGWQILGKAIAKCADGWSISRMSQERFGGRIARIAIAAGIVDKAEPWLKEVKPGIGITGYSMAKVKDNGGIVFLLGFAEKKSSAVLYLRRESVGMVASVLSIDGGSMEDSCPQAAFSINDGLLLVSISHWLSNYAGSMVSYYQKLNNRWACVSQQETSFQIYQYLELNKIKANENLYVGTAKGRAFPEHLNVAHVNADVDMRARFYFDGHNVYKREWRVSNAWAIFDDLIYAIGRNDRKTVSAMCMRSKDVAKLMNYKQVAKSDPSASNISSVCTVDDHVFDLPAMRYRFFFAKAGSNWKLARLKQISDEDD